MKVELDANRNDLINFAIYTLLEDEKEAAPLIQNALNKETGKFEYDIELKINGKEFNFIKILDRIVNQENEIIEEEVKKFLINKFENIRNITDNIIENLKILDLDIENIL